MLTKKEQRGLTLPGPLLDGLFEPTVHVIRKLNRAGVAAKATVINNLFTSSDPHLDRQLSKNQCRH